MTLKVMGLDLSITATGVCMPSGATITLSVPGGAKAGDTRLVSIRDYIRESLRIQPADLVAIEGPVTRTNTATVSGMVHGAVRTALMDAGVPYALVPPATLKAYATGKGNADKTAMALAAFKRSGREFPDDNQCDAAWLRWAALDWFGSPEFALPAEQRKRLAKVDWPAVPDPVEGQSEEPAFVIEEYTITGTGDDRIVLAESPARRASDPVPCHFDAR